MLEVKVKEMLEANLKEMLEAKMKEIRKAKLIFFFYVLFHSSTLLHSGFWVYKVVIIVDVDEFTVMH